VRSTNREPGGIGSRFKDSTIKTDDRFLKFSMTGGEFQTDPEAKQHASSNQHTEEGITTGLNNS